MREEEAQKKVQSLKWFETRSPGAYIPKHQAYQAVIDGKVYFCELGKSAVIYRKCKKS